MLHGLPRSRNDKGITLSASLADRLIHERRDSIIVVTSHELGERASVKFAPRRLEPQRKPLSVLKHVVRYRHSGFHTESMIMKRCLVKAGGTTAISGSRPMDYSCRSTLSRVRCIALLALSSEQQVIFCMAPNPNPNDHSIPLGCKHAMMAPHAG